MAKNKISRKQIKAIMAEIGDQGLIDFYNSDVCALRKLETKYGISHVTWRRRLVKLGIKIRSNAQSKIGLPVWNQGRGCINYAGYRVITIAGKQVMEHRIIMEKWLGRKLSAKEVVHHKNHIRTDNRIENLQLFNTHAEHIRIHFTKEELRARGLKGLRTSMENREKRRIEKYGSGNPRRARRSSFGNKL